MKLSVHSRLVFFVMFAGLVALVILPNLGRADSRSEKTTSSSPSGQSRSQVTPSALSLVVNRVGDGHDGNPGDGVCEVTTGNSNCTLRAAIEEYEASAAGSGSTINFNLSSLPAVINLVSQLPDLTKNLTINGTVGTGLNPITVRGNNSFTIFTVNSGITVHISNLNIEDGSTSVVGKGGGITNSGTLTLDRCSIDGNSSVTGGGIYGSGSSVTTINQSSVINNTASNLGSGIFGAATSTVNLNNSTVAQNTGSWGVATNSGTINIASSTITGNQIRGILNTSGTVTLYNTISAANQGDDLTGAFISNGNNMISNTANETGVTDGVNGDIVTAHIGLSPLGNYGGPTPTVALMRASFLTFGVDGRSLAIDAGNNVNAPATDQRGVARPFNTTIDIGAFEATIDCTPLVLPQGAQNVPYSQSIAGINGTGPYTFSIVKLTLPPGLTLSPTGMISGTPTQSGSFLFDVAATDSTGVSGVHDYVIGINADSQLAITQINGGADPIAGQPFTVVVESQDFGNNPSPVNTNTAVSLSLNTGTGALGGTLTGTILDGSSSVTISGVTYNKAESGVSLTVTRTSGDNLTAGTSAAFTVDAPTTVYSGPSNCGGNSPCFSSLQAAINAVASGGTVNIGSKQYNEDVDFNKSGTYNVNGTITVNNLTLSSGTLNITSPSFSINLNGNWTHNGGTFVPAGAIVQMFGDNTTIGGTSPTTFFQLTLDTTGTAIGLTNNITVTQLLLLITDLDTGTFSVTLPNNAVPSGGNGDVIGTVVRTGFVSGGPFLTFGNQNNSIQINSGVAPTSIAVKMTKTVPTDASTGQTNSGFPNAVARTYVITPTGGSGFSATVKLHYTPGDLNGNTESSLNLWRFDSGTGKWNNMGASVRDTANHSVKQSGIAQFSPWTLNSVVPTAVDFDSANVTRIGDSALIEWKTGREVNNLGFNIYRESNGGRVKINPSLIAGSALMVGSDVRVEAGNGYMWTDSAGDASVSYWIEDLDLNGSSVWRGPFGVTQSRAGNSKANSGLLSELNQSKQNTAVVQREHPAGMTTVTGSTVSTTTITSGRTSNRPTALPSALTKQWSIAAQPALKIAVNKTGWYHLSVVDLIAAGLDSNTSPSALQMFVGGTEIPIKVNTKNQGFFSADDSIEFYGSAINAPSSDTQIYWLVSGLNGKRIGSVQSPGTANSSGPASFLYTVERKDRSLYFASLRNGDTENWFGAVVNSNSALQSLNIHHLDQNSISPAEIEIALQGVTTNSHQVNIMLNGSAIESITFDGMTHKTVKISIPQSSLSEGNNQITLAALGAGDVSLIDYVRVTYAHTYAADSNYLFTSATMQAVQIGGFTSNQITAIDVTDPKQPVEVQGTIAGENGDYSISIGPAKRRNLLALTPDQMLHPVSMTSNQPSMLNKASNGADYLIITHKDLASIIQPFAAFKESEGYQVKVVDVDSIYDEFSYGVHTPQALKDFLNWTYLHWSKQPQYVLLAGSGSLDPKNYTDLSNNDLVPVKLIDTSSMETASDDWFVDFDNDGLPQMSIGRLPVRTAAEAATVINKIINYEQSGHTSAMVLVSDISDNADFNAPNNQIKSIVPANLPVVNIVRGQTETDPKTELMSQLSQGERIVNYAGHGSVSLWRGNLLANSDVLTLSSHKASALVVTMTCLNGYFQDPKLASLGESLLKVNQGGAVSVWASSGMTDSAAQTTMNQVFFTQLFNNRNITLGQAIRAAKAAVQDNDVRRTWVLFGDPTMRIK